MIDEYDEVANRLSNGLGDFIGDDAAATILRESFPKVEASGRLDELAIGELMGAVCIYCPDAGGYDCRDDGYDGCKARATVKRVIAALLAHEAPKDDGTEGQR